MSRLMELGDQHVRAGLATIGNKRQTSGPQGTLNLASIPFTLWQDFGNEYVLAMALGERLGIGHPCAEGSAAAFLLPEMLCRRDDKRVVLDQCP